MNKPQGFDPSIRPWRLLTRHGLVLFCISVRPGCAVAEISDALSVTRRTVYGILGDLRRAGMVSVRKEGRSHHYSVDCGATVGHSVVSGGAELRDVLRFLVGRTQVLLDEGSSPKTHRS